MIMRHVRLRTLAGFAIALLLAARPVAATERPDMTWGKVPLEQLRMTSFPADSNANAVVLFDYGEGSFSSDYDLTFNRHTRIKILTKAGFEMGTVAIPFYVGESGERISHIEGITTSLGPDGEPVQTELDDDEIFTEDVRENWRRIRFTLPALKEGCVIEFRYTRSTESPMYLPDWDFQTDEPVLWSEYHVVTPLIFQYAVVTFGPPTFAIEDVHFEDRTFLGATGAHIIKMQILHYARADVPALRSEPFITTLDDYRMKLSVQLSAVQWPGQHIIKILNTWPSLLEELLKLDIGGALKGTSRTEELARALTQRATSPREKLAAIYDHIHRTIVWDGMRTYGVDQKPNDVLTSKRGNCAEINTLLVAMARAAGLDATPVLVSTRSHGSIQKLWPLFTNFDYLIAQVMVDGQPLLVDATDRHRPLTILPTRALNHQGLLLKEGTETWVPISPSGDSREEVSVSAALKTDGSMTGSVLERFTGYRASDARSAIEGKKEDDYVKGLLRTETTGFAHESFSIGNRDSCDLPMDVRIAFTAPAAAQVLEDRIFINPMLFERTTQNPFKSATRMFPVDIPYGSVTTYTIDLALPTGYLVASTPADVSVLLPGNGGRYTRSVIVKADTVSLSTRFEFARTYFEPRLYRDLRAAFDRLVTCEAEQIVLTKAPPPPPPPPAKVAAPKTKKK